jgi:hypothetical protein
MKRCSKCCQEKMLTEFRSYKQGRYLHSWCNACRVAGNKAWRRANTKEREPKVYFPPFGEKSHKAKLTNHDARLIKELLSAGLTLKAIGEKFEVAAQTISDIKHGRSWTHV